MPVADERILSIEHWWNDAVLIRSRPTRKKTCPSVLLSNKNYTWTGLTCNLDLRTRTGFFRVIRISSISIIALIHRHHIHSLPDT
jgi:hypothetical protein